jgi:perosamine synthetase
MRLRRHRISQLYRKALAGIDAIELPPENENRIHAWHLFPIRLRAEALRITRDEFVQQLRVRGVASSVHWRPLHLHPYYQQTFAWPPELFPTANDVWQVLVSLPVFPAMRKEEQAHVVQSVTDICVSYSR